jgi:hypothetical protein
MITEGARAYISSNSKMKGGSAAVLGGGQKKRERENP